MNKVVIIVELLLLGIVLTMSVLLYQVSTKDRKIKALNQQIVELEQKVKVIDSLDAELFPLEIELNRYEMAFQIFAKRHPVYAEIYASIISNETE
jgi:Tfp pilus assembly protein PilN